MGVGDITYFSSERCEQLNETVIYFCNFLDYPTKNKLYVDKYVFKVYNIILEVKK